MLSMNHYCEQWIADWCETNGWTDWFRERSRYWAFPPNSVMPVPIPNTVLQAIKAEKGLSADERMWGFSALAVSAIAALWSYVEITPMPVVLAFVYCAIVFANLEDEDL